MSFRINADLVPLFRGLVTGLQPFAAAQDVQLLFESTVKNLYASYNPEEALSEITVLLSRVVSFTPQSYTVKVFVGECEQNNDRCLLVIENTGVDLSKLGEILSAVKSGLQVEKFPKGTRFTVSIPTKKNGNAVVQVNSNGTLLPKKYPMYFSAVKNRLATHFSNTENLEKAAASKSNNEGVFLKKVNAVINSHMSDAEFKVDALANAMALSRTQLFRKIKSLTQMSPQQYLRYVRLEKAKKLLQSKNENLNVSEVCYQVGFASKSHFTRTFQKEFGFNPSDFTKAKM
ncbi:helix-turn-helix transcriptional regulator [Aurantibacter crassamenti]|uniref:helix-turn-helix transcriptional regulator n=1 Tax=Aurantibacter crassamenti TaxID=1837375 RepID=UPI001939EFEC|nr:helix-turn-helix transcriptional regulator [Aurantibacter crassamenti]MBM1107827.1 helix-turn-helix transcriptional regulator [Aurantibacter crassamenti]